MASKPHKMKAYASFTDWKSDQSVKNKKLITALTKLIQKTVPQFSTMVKWGQGCWVLEDRPKVFIHCEDDHVQLGFYAGTKMKDPQKLLIGKGKHVRHVKIFTPKDIKPKEFSELVAQVIKL